MKKEQLKPKDKVVVRMKRDGAKQENLTEVTPAKITKSSEDAQLVQSHETEAPASPKKPKKHPQARPEDVHPKQEAQMPPASDNKSADQPQPDAAEKEQPKPEEYKPGELPVSDGSSHIPVAPEEHRAVPADPASVVVATAITSSVRKAKVVKAVDGQGILNKASDTAAKKPATNAPAPTKKIQRLEKKAEQAHERLDTTRESLPTKKVLKKERVFDEATGKGKTRLHFEDEIKPPKQPSKLQFETKKTVSKVGDSLAAVVHGRIHEAEQDNSAVEAAHKTEILVESTARHYSHHRQDQANKPYEKVSKLEHEAEIADTKLHYEKTRQEYPEMKKQQNMNGHYQKQQIKQEYAAARKAGTQTAGTATASTAKKTGEKAADKVKEFFSKNKKYFIWFGVGLGILILLAAGISSCTAMFSSTGQAVIASSYLSEDDAMLGAEEQYCRMEAELQTKLDNYEATHDYDEYYFDPDDIEHDPYVLISILSALHEGEWTLSEVQGTLEMLFEKQYLLTEDVIEETRYRTETRTGTRTVTDPDTGESYEEDYEYTVQVPYSYYICNVTLENFNLSHVPVYIMGQDELSMYATYMSVLGNREDLFPSSGYVDKYVINPPRNYEVPAEYLSDERFATLLAEAENYLGYPYVWGGSNPETSFDCSGFVSYVLTNSGLVNTGRLGTQELYNICTPVSKANAKPGDLIFFTGTYDTPGVSHVGIYVGDNVMLHCGDPIQYTSISSSYWQSHFFAFGRPPY